MNAFVSSFAPSRAAVTNRPSSCPRRAPAAPAPSAPTPRMGAYEDFYSSRKSQGPDSAAPAPSLYEAHYPADGLYCAPAININAAAGSVSVASTPVALPDVTPPVDSAAYAGGADPALWERYYPRARVNMAPHIAIVPGESVALSQKVVYPDVESVQRNAKQDAAFESGWSAGWRPASRW